MKTRHRLFTPTDQPEQDDRQRQREYDAGDREEETGISAEEREARRIDLLVHRNKEDE